MFNIRTYIRAFLGSIILIGMAAAVGNAQNRTVRVQGYGVSRTSALNDAKRNAVEQGIGVIVASETLVRNAILVSDKIYSKANGFVKNYKELDSKIEADGNYVITIEAEVTDILDEIIKDQIALDLLLQWLNKPRFMVIIDENFLGDKTSIIAESEIGKMLNNKNFSLVSKSQVERIRKRVGNLSSLAGNLDEAAAIGTEFGAEIFVQGKANASTVELKGETYADMGLDGMFSGQASISASVIRTGTGDIIAVNTFTGKKTHISRETAAVEALREASVKLGDYLIKESVRAWSLEQSNTRTFQLRISSVNFKRRKTIENFLNNLDGIQSVRRVSFGSGNAVLSVEYEGGTLDDLAEQLDSKDLGDFLLEITGDSPDMLLLKVSIK